MTVPFKTVLFGFGMMGSGFSDDPVMAQYFDYASHAQVLRDHPLFSWEAVVDPSEKALKFAGERYNIPILAKNVNELTDKIRPDVAIIATPPRNRQAIIEMLPGLKGVIVEKPLGANIEESRLFVETCNKRGVHVQVNFWRRGDELFRKLADGELEKYIGQPLTAFGLYGNGIRNNGIHMIDFVQMLFGEIEHYQLLTPESSFSEGPIKDDRNIGFLLRLNKGFTVVYQPIPFNSYREVSLDIWGEQGRLGIYQESLGIYHYHRTKNRAIKDEWEIASDKPVFIKQTCGRALYNMYDNLAEAMVNQADLLSTGEAAIRTETIVCDLLNAKE